MRAFLCDTRTWGRGSAPLEEGHRPCRLSWDKKVEVSGLCHSRSFPGTLSDAAAGLLYLHQDTCSARLRLYSNTKLHLLLPSGKNQINLRYLLEYLDIKSKLNYSLGLFFS